MKKEDITGINSDVISGYYDLMIKTFNTIYLDIPLGERINRVLAMVGGFLNVSRTYVFEDDIEHGVSRNTYEWCADGVEPQIQELQEVPLSDIEAWHNMLKNSGIVLADDIMTLPPEIYEILEPQEIKSLVVLPLYVNNDMIGYIGFDECRDYRKWTDREVEMLRAMTTLLVTLISRHNAEKHAEASLTIFRTVLDNIETPIYVTDPKTDKILFANRRHKEEIGSFDIEGKVCWQILNPEGAGRCEYCPITRLIDSEDCSKPLNSEVYYPALDKWYYRSDMLIDWIDGRTAHLQTSLDITSRKRYEEKLKFSATYDMMTGILNRESGLTLLREALTESAKDGSTLTFCYLDVDGLKYANDNFGHVEGDRLINMIVSVIRQVVRKSDIFARLGGDEFMLAFRECKIKNAELKVAKIRSSLDELNLNSDLPYKVSVSVGLLEVEPDVDYNIDTILMIADKRMYRDKQFKKERLGK